MDNDMDKIAQPQPQPSQTPAGITSNTTMPPTSTTFPATTTPRKLQITQKSNSKAKIAIITLICVAIAAMVIAIATLLVNKLTTPDFDNYNTEECPNGICDPNYVIQQDDKPILYLYPTTDTEVTVELGNPDQLTVTYPTYTNNWHVLASPDGTLTDLNTNQSLYALYYESKASENLTRTDTGFIIRGSDTATFLEDKLSILGLTPRESEEFIVYWLPQLQSNPYNYIRFATNTEIAENMPLKITPTPDSTIRILMLFEPLTSPINITEQQLTTPTRTGFTAVEWGGVRLDKKAYTAHINQTTKIAALLGKGGHHLTHAAILTLQRFTTTRVNPGA